MRRRKLENKDKKAAETDQFEYQQEIVERFIKACTTADVPNLTDTTVLSNEEISNDARSSGEKAEDPVGWNPKDYIESAEILGEDSSIPVGHDSFCVLM